MLVVWKSFISISFLLKKVFLIVRGLRIKRSQNKTAIINIQKFQIFTKRAKITEIITILSETTIKIVFVYMLNFFDIYKIFIPFWYKSIAFPHLNQSSLDFQNGSKKLFQMDSE